MEHPEGPDGGCAYLAGLLGDPLTGTATEATAWILVEHPGPWGKDALKDSGFDPKLVAELKDREKLTGVRVQMIEPPAGREAALGYLALDPRGGDPDLYRMPLGGLADTLDLDFAALARGIPPEQAERHPENLYIVCANAKSDPCCGRTGPAVLEAVRGLIGDRARRTAHVGGHKYASNMVVFPYGLFYGRLEPNSAADVVAAHESGRIHLDKYRGRSAYLLPEQAAECLLRRELGLTALASLRLESHGEQPAEDVRAVTFASAESEYRVVVSCAHSGPARLQSCTDEKPTLPLRWTLEEVSTSVAGPR